MLHELKTWPIYFRRVFEGQKKFEVRKNDRDYMIGDILRLAEWDNDKQEYTGREEYYNVDYVLQGGSFGIEDGYCVMSISPAKF